MNLQSFVDGVVVNRHPFGVELQRFCQCDEVIDILPGYGFMDGGCYELAQALQSRLRGSGVPANLYAVGRPDACDHVVVGADTPVDGRLYLDADGLADERSLIEKMQKVEGIDGPVVIEAFDEKFALSRGYGDRKGTPVVAELAQQLSLRLGPIGRNRLTLINTTAPGGGNCAWGSVVMTTFAR